MRFARAYVIALVVVVVWFWGFFPKDSLALLGAAPLMDEAYYLGAARAVLEGRALENVEGWFYPAPLAYMFALIVSTCGEYSLLLGLRMANFLGMVAVWLVAAQVTLGKRRVYAPLLVPVLAWASNPYWCLVAGNVSGIIALPLYLAMSLRHRPSLRVGLLALSTLVKPYAVGLVLREHGGRSFWLLAMIALVSTTTRVHGGEMPADFYLEMHHSTTLARIVVDIGLPWQVAPILAWGFGLAILAKDGTLSNAQSLVVSWLALPIVSPHHTTTVLVLVPLAIALRRAGKEETRGNAWMRLSVLRVVLLGTILLQEDAFGLPVSVTHHWIGSLYSSLPVCAAGTLLCILRRPRQN